MRERAVHSTRRTETTPDGRNIIAREHNALAPHPHPSQNGRLVPTRGVNKILVELNVGDPNDVGDGIELYECDACGRTSNSPKSTVSHMVSHNSNNTAPDYDVKTMKTLVAIVTKYKTARVRGFCEKAAEELNTIGVTRRDGQPWHASGVSHAYNHWKDRPEVRRARRVTAASVSAPPASKPTRSPKTTRVIVNPVPLKQTRRASQPVDVVTVIHDAVRALDGISAGLQNLAHTITETRVPEVIITPAELEELRTKAAQYDAISAALRGLQNGG